jgi:hypothetical protein
MSRHREVVFKGEHKYVRACKTEILIRFGGRHMCEEQRLEDHEDKKILIRGSYKTSYNLMIIQRKVLFEEEL